MQGTSKGHDDDDDDDDQWVRNRGTPTPLYECFIFSHYKLRWSSTMTTQDGLISIDSENLRNRFKDIQKTRLAEGGSSGSNNGDEEKLEQEHANVDVVCPREVAP